MRTNIYERMEELVEEMKGDWKGLFLSQEFYRFCNKYAQMLVAGIFESLRIEKVSITKQLEESVLKRMEIRLLFDPNSDVKTGVSTMTDNKFIIMLNGAGTMIQKVPDVQGKFDVLMGILVHEISHRIFTDFPTYQTAQISFSEKGRFYPLPPKNISSQEGMMFRSRLIQNPEYRKTYTKVYSFLMNALEDGYIETECKAHYPGEPSYYLNVTRRTLYDLSSSISDTMNASTKVDQVKLVLDQWLLYATLLTFKEGEMSTDNLPPEVEEVLFAGLDTIEEALVERDPRVRAQLASELLVILSTLVDEAIEEEEKNQEGKKQNGGSKQANEAIQEALEQLMKQFQGMPQHSGQQSKSVSNPNTPGNGKMDKNALRSKADKNKVPGGPGGAGSGEEHDASVSQRTLEEILNDIAAREVAKEEEDKRARELQADAETFCGTQAKVFRASDVPEERKEIYDALFDKVAAISKRLARITKQRFKEEAEDNVNRLVSGGRMNIKSYIRDPMKGFERRVSFDSRVNLEVFVLIDESGSMTGAGEAAAMQTAILMEDYCRQVPVPLTVYGYTTGETCCDLYSYVEPTKIDRLDKYRLTGISARGGTPTVAAMRYALGRMAKGDPKSNKLLFVITDGGAGDDDYEGTLTKELLEKAQKMKTQVIACGIGGYADAVKDEFGEDHYIGIGDDELEDMPQQLLQIVQKNAIATRRI